MEHSIGKTGLGLLQAEVGVLQMAISDALERALRGQMAEGYAILLEGRRRVDEFAATGESWAVSLAGAYREALEQYDREFVAALV